MTLQFWSAQYSIYCTVFITACQQSKVMFKVMLSRVSVCPGWRRGRVSLVPGPFLVSGPMSFPGGRVSLVPCSFSGVGYLWSHVPFGGWVYPTPSPGYPTLPGIPYSPWDTLLSLGYPTLPGVPYSPWIPYPCPFQGVEYLWSHVLSGGMVSLVPCPFWGVGIPYPRYPRCPYPWIPYSLWDTLSPGYPTSQIPTLWMPHTMDTLPHGYHTLSGCSAPWIP